MEEIEKDNIIYHNDIPVDVRQWNDILEIESNIEIPKQTEYLCKVKKESYEHYILRKCRKKHNV